MSSESFHCFLYPPYDFFFVSRSNSVLYYAYKVCISIDLAYLALQRPVFWIYIDTAGESFAVYFFLYILRCECQENIVSAPDLYHSNQKQHTFSEALLFMESLAERLILTDNEILSSTGYTYRKWEV